MTKVPESAWLNDILRAIDKIERHPQYSLGRQGYDADEYYRDVVQLNIERLCEAATHLCDDHGYDEKHPDVPWRKIIGTRIIIAHHYWEIEDETIWNIVANHLPALKRKVQGWLINM